MRDGPVIEMTAYFSRDRSANGIQTQQILSRARGQMTNQIRRQKVVSVANRFKNLPTTVGGMAIEDDRLPVGERLG